MQRKNSILIPLKSTIKNNLRATKRKGFAMIMAIGVIVILSTIMALTLSMTSKAGKRTIDMYLHEQVVLYSKSAVELALLDIANLGCINNYNNTLGGVYDVNITMLYIYTGPRTNDDGTINCAEFTPGIYIQTPEQDGSVLMDITVSTNEGSEPITYFRRVIQKL